MPYIFILYPDLNLKWVWPKQGACVCGGGNCKITATWLNELMLCIQVNEHICHVIFLRNSYLNACLCAHIWLFAACSGIQPNPLGTVIATFREMVEKVLPMRSCLCIHVWHILNNLIECCVTSLGYSYSIILLQCSNLTGCTDILHSLMWSWVVFFPPGMWERWRMWEDVQLSASTSNRFLKWEGEKHHFSPPPPILLTFLFTFLKRISLREAE